MSKKELNMNDLDKVSGGYITGTIDGQALKVSGSNDAYVVTLGGSSGTYTKQDVINFVNDALEEPMTPEQTQELFAAIESNEDHDIGDW